MDGARVVLRARVSTSRAGNSITRLTVPEEAQEGVYNGVAWAMTKLSGARIKHGADRYEAIRSARMLEEGRWREFYPRSQVEAVETVEGSRCFRVALLPSADRRTGVVRADTGLLVRQRADRSEAETYTVEVVADAGWPKRRTVSMRRRSR